MDIDYTAGSSTQTYMLDANIDEYSYCSYHADGRYKTLEYLEDGVVKSPISNSWTSIWSSSLPSFLSSFRDNSNLGWLDMGRF